MLFDDPQLWQYDQYLIVLNATSPYAPLGISPVFHYSKFEHGLLSDNLKTPFFCLSSAFPYPDD